MAHHHGDHRSDHCDHHHSDRFSRRLQLIITSDHNSDRMLTTTVATKADITTDHHTSTVADHPSDPDN